MKPDPSEGDPGGIHSNPSGATRDKGPGHRGIPTRGRRPVDPSWLRRSLLVLVPLSALVVAAGYVTLGHIYVYTRPDFGFEADDRARIKEIEEGRRASQVLRIGDRILSVAWAGQEPRRVRSGFHWLMIEREVGQRSGTFIIERDGQRHRVRLEAGYPGVLPGLWWSLGSFLVVLILGIVLWARRRDEPGFAGYIVVILNTYIVLYGFTHMRGILPSPPLFLGYLFFDFFTLPLLLHLFLVYPTPVGWVRRRPALPVLFYLPQMAVSLAAAVGYLRVVEAPTLENQQAVLLLGKWAIPLIFLAYLLAGMAVMVVRFLTAPVERRKQIQWVIYGGVMAGFLTAAFSIFQWRTSPVVWLLEGSEYLLPVYALLALTIAFSFMEFRLVDVDRIVHRSLVYAVLSGLVVVVYLVLAGGLGWLLTRVFDTTSSTVIVVSTVGSAALFFPLRRAVQANVDRLFFRHHTVYEEILAQASSEFVTMLDLGRLSKVLLDMLVTKLHRRHALLLLAGEDRRLEVVHAAGRPVSHTGVLPAVDSFTLRKLRAHSSGETVAAARLLQGVSPQRLAREFEQIFERLDASVVVFLVLRDKILGVLALGPKVDGSMISSEEITMLEALGRQLSVVVQNASAYTEIEQLSRDLARRQQEVTELKNRLEAENVYLRAEIQEAARFGEIVGESEGMQRVLERVARVAASDATVLIRGESGTGKELVARAIHEASGRRDRALVTINCAAIPEGLLESELFGHVKGAFTGAVASQRGRFELADGGTLFFDEVGDMPLSLQAKLLRALQEREIYPVGGERPVRVDVRVISATHRDLERRVAEGGFREDLFYRLNVVPLDIPPLRERPEDIPLLAEYFADLFARRTGKAVTGISRAAMDRLEAYHWPGNVRELANVIERAVVLTRVSVLDEEVTLPAGGAAPPSMDSLPGGSPDPLAPGAPGIGPGGRILAYHDAVAEYKRRLLAEAIRRAEGNRAQAARDLGLQRTYLYRLVRQLEVE